MRSVSSASVVDSNPPACVHRRVAPGPDRARHHRHRAQRGEGLAVEILAGDILQALPQRQQVHAIADFDIAGDCPHARVANGCTSKRTVSCWKMVSASMHTTISVRRQRERGIQRGGFAAILFMHQGDARLIREVLLQRGKVSSLEPSSTTITCNRRVVIRQHRLHRAADHFAFVIGGDGHGHRRGILQPRAQPLPPAPSPRGQARAGDSAAVDSISFPPFLRGRGLGERCVRATARASETGCAAPPGRWRAGRAGAARR